MYYVSIGSSICEVLFVRFLLEGLGLGSFWVFGFFLGSVVRRNSGFWRNSGSKHSAHFCFDDQAFYDGGEFDAVVVVVLRIFVSMIKLFSSRRRI
jgi:hypothetical protein